MLDLPFECFDPAEHCGERTPREILARLGYTPLPPDELDDRQLPGRLWELLYAAAARRFYFHATDHLSDRELYTLLWNQWLDEPTADIPPEAETNTTFIVSVLNAKGMTHEEIWLRYYAEEADRVPLSPGEIIPPHEDPPYDRDRHLPLPPIPLEAHDGWLPGDDDPPEDASDDESDPLGLAAVDREIAAAKGESNPDEASFDTPNPVESQLSGIKPENWTPPAQQLAAKNIPLLPPAEITDETLTPILWELLHKLSLQGFYVLHTDHLTDRELYAELWERGLRDPAHLPGRNPRGGWYHDFLGSWGEDDMQLWLRYYATDEERAKHAQEHPEDVIPPKKNPSAIATGVCPKGRSRIHLPTMNWKDSELPALRELESAILNVWRQHEAMNDYTAGGAYDAAYQHYRARLRGREPNPVALTGLNLDTFKTVHEVCEKLLTSGPAQLKGVAAGNTNPVTVEKLVEYLRELNRSVERHNKTGGHHGYLKFVRDFIP